MSKDTPVVLILRVELTEEDGSFDPYLLEEAENLVEMARGFGGILEAKILNLPKEMDLS